MTPVQILRKTFEILTQEQKANVRMHLNNGVPVLAGDQANVYTSPQGGL